MRYLLPADRYDVAHPLIGRAYAVYTPMIDQMVSTIGNWIDEQRPGGYIFGPSRIRAVSDGKIKRSQVVYARGA